MWTFAGTCRAGEFDQTNVSIESDANGNIDMPEAAKKAIGTVLVDMDPSVIVRFAAQGDLGPGGTFLGSRISINLNVPVDLNRPGIGEQLVNQQPSNLELPGGQRPVTPGPHAQHGAQPHTES